ncbi:MAG: hypothetical protein WA071_25455 [Undibacterium umbellatum]|jgi:hypothetical protein|uniref:hypothetical protein n=1 Tax=Undibacterium TaxID=401469 RepID=UPI00272F342D|nr:hypothetical protein [Undibacterium sp.]MDP1977814.1 hypothetical protein [Undibacterium sp.]
MMRFFFNSLLFIFLGFAASGLVLAQVSVGSEPTEDSPWFSLYVIEKTAKQQAEINKKFLVKEADAVKKIDTSLAYAYPKLAVLRPGGIIAGEPDKRFAMIYRKMAWYAANDQVVSAQILFYTAVRLKQTEQNKGVVLDLPYLTLHHFIYNSLCVDISQDGEYEQPACKTVQTVASRAQAELRNEKLRQYLNWAALGLGFEDKIAYEAGVFLMERENPTRNEKDTIKSILKPLLKKNAG